MFFATVHVTYSPQVAKWHSLDFSAFPTSLSIQPQQISEMQRLWFDASGKKVPKNTRLTSACYPNILSQHLELLFYECLFLGGSITKVERIVRSKGFPIFRNYINGLNAQRQKETSVVHSAMIKALSNSLAGKLHMDVTKKLKTVVCQSADQFSNLLRDDHFYDVCKIGQW